MMSASLIKKLNDFLKQLDIVGEVGRSMQTLIVSLVLVSLPLVFSWYRINAKTCSISISG